MVAKNRATTGTRQTKKLKLKTETIKGLDVKGKGKDVKGGQRPIETNLCTRYYTECGNC